ncbi:MAG: hypothetical protein ACN4GZ_20345 [Acidimicrobiales bacterium]
MRKILIAAFVVLAATLSGVAAEAGSPNVEEFYPGIDFPDFENGFVVFLNTTRDAICTEEQIEAEFETIAWFESGDADEFFQYLDENDGDPTGFEGTFPPEEPPRPEGIVAFRRLSKETGKGALVESVRGTDVPTELWRQDENPPGVGPCTDTLGQSGPYATGTAMARANDNNLFDSPSRNTSFGNRLKATLTDNDGNKVVYSTRFHLNFRCNTPEFGPPACLIERTTIR